MPRSGKVTLELNAPVSPERLIAQLRKTAPHILDEAPVPPESRARPVKANPRPDPSARAPEAERLLTPAEVATMFRVDPKTVTRWAKAGKLTSIKTLGGHRRYRESEIRALISETDTAQAGES
jgi:excisionase family DNA binding protein